MKFGLSDKDFQTLSELVINPIRDANARIFVFGSRATGRNHPFSDIDLLIDDSNCSQDIRAVMSTASEAIEESSLPIKVDLVLLRDLAASYRESVMSERVEFP